MHVRSLVGAVLWAASSAAFAQSSAEDLDRMYRSLEGTIYTISHRSSADGVLDGCGIEFAAITPDFSTRGGAYVRIVGSVYVRSHPTADLAYMLKLGVFDNLTSSKGEPPSSAFFRSPRSEAPAKSIRGASDNPSFALFVGVVDKQVMDALSSIVEDRKLVIGFNRKPGQQDVSTVLDLAVSDVAQAGVEVVRKREDRAVPEFAACMSSLSAKALNDARQ